MIFNLLFINIRDGCYFIFLLLMLSCFILQTDDDKFVLRVFYTENEKLGFIQELNYKCKVMKCFGIGFYGVLRD